MIDLTLDEKTHDEGSTSVEETPDEESTSDEETSDEESTSDEETSDDESSFDEDEAEARRDARRLRFSEDRKRNFEKEIPNRRTIDSSIYRWLLDKEEKTKSVWTDGKTIYSYEKPVGYTDDLGRKILWNYTAKGLGYVSHNTSHHVNRIAPYADRVLNKKD